MANGDVFTAEALAKLRFDSTQEAFQHLKIEAMRAGFDIATNQSFRSNYLTVYCVKGGRERGKTTSKSGCEWKLCIVPTDEPHCFAISRPSLQHNHDLTPDKYSI